MIKNCLKFCLPLLLAFHTSTLFAAEIEKLADDDWLLVKSSNFEIITDLDEEKGRHLVEDLEAYRYFSIQLMKLDVLSGIKSLKILAISSSSNFKKLDLPENWAGVFSLDAFGYSAIANVNNYRTNLKTNTFARQVLFHEYNHFLVRLTSNNKHLPMWYDEGMAEYWGSFKYDGEKVYIGDPSAIEGRIYDLVNGAGTIILESKKLFNTSTLPLTSKKESDKAAVGRFYAQSFFIIHYLNSAPELRVSLNNYIAYLSSGYLEEQAFQKAFNMTYEQLDKNAKKYLNKSLMMRVMSFTDKNIVFPKPELTVTKLDKANFYLLMGEMLPNYGVMDAALTKQLLEKTIQLNPTNTDAKVSLLIRGLAPEPQKLVKELEQIDPKNAMLLTYQADSLRSGANLLRSAGVDGWEEQMKKARTLYRRAIKNDPTLALPYFGLGDVYNFLPSSEPLQEAIAGFDTASLYSRNQSTFSDLADIYIRMDKGLEAIPALRNVVAATPEKEKSFYSIALDNLELLNNTTTDKGELTADGLSYSTGNLYKGPVANGKPHGIGKVTRPNGSYYEGNFANGLMQGQGKLVTYGGYIYEGEFQNGIARGKGKITYPEGSWKKSYTGEVFYAVPFGKGSEVNKSGTYEGDYWYSWYQGQGTFTSTDGKTLLKGKWVQNRFEWPEENGIVFIGSASDSGKREGYGVCLKEKRAKIDWCTYKEGQLQEKSDESTPEKNN